MKFLKPWLKKTPLFFLPVISKILFQNCLIYDGIYIQKSFNVSSYAYTFRRRIIKYHFMRLLITFHRLYYFAHL
jgi:hypothetical protein